MRRKIWIWRGWPVDDLKPKDKDLFLANQNGDYAAYTTEEVLNRGLAKWKGWKCAAGFENLCVSPEGECWSATCKVGGKIGRIYEGEIRAPKQWIDCTKEVCSCGSDMQIRKARNENYQGDPFLNVPEVGLLKDLPGPADFAGPLHFFHGVDQVSVTWDLSRRCNYKCSYCPPWVSNQTDPLHSWEKLRDGYRVVRDQFIRDRTAKFVLTGGEPTLHSAFMDLVQMIHRDGHLVHTQTNGSRKPEYYAELIKYSFIGISLHLEFAKVDHIKKVAKAIIKKRRWSWNPKKSWFGISVMVPPGMLEEARRWRDELTKVNGIRKYCVVTFSPIYEPEDTNKLQEYGAGELEALLSMWDVSQ